MPRTFSSTKTWTELQIGKETRCLKDNQKTYAVLDSPVNGVSDLYRYIVNIIIDIEQ